jgi:hypothetical protein
LTTGRGSCRLRHLARREQGWKQMNILFTFPPVFPLIPAFSAFIPLKLIRAGAFSFQTGKYFLETGRKAAFCY